MNERTCERTVSKPAAQRRCLGFQDPRDGNNGQVDAETGGFGGKSSPQVAIPWAEKGARAPPWCNVDAVTGEGDPRDWGGSWLAAAGGPVLTEACGLRVPICEGPTAASTRGLMSEAEPGAPASRPPGQAARAGAPDGQPPVSLPSPPSDEAPQTSKDRALSRPAPSGSDWLSVSLNLVLYGLPHQAIV